MRTPNINKLYNKFLECESEWNSLQKSGFKISNAIVTGTDLRTFQSFRNRFRTVYERFLVEEPEFFSQVMLFDGFWRRCYAEHIDDLQVAIKNEQSSTVQNNLTLFMSHLIFEGVSLFTLLLRAHFSAQIRFEILLLLAQLKHLQASGQEQALLQEALTLCPEDGRAVFLLAKFAQIEGDLLLALYWCLSSLSTKKPAGDDALALLKTLANHLADCPGNVLYSNSRLNYMKPNKRAALDATLLAIGPVLQLLVHGIASQLGSKSHFKHLDQLAHFRLTQLDEQQIDFEAVERVLEAFWLAICNSKMFPSNNLILPQAVMLAGVFRFMRKYRLGGLVEGIKLYSGKNYEIGCKIYPFFAECLHDFLESLPAVSSAYIEALIAAGLLVKQDDQLFVRPVLERSNRLNRSMKVLTHRLLEVRVNELASPIEAAERLQQRPWKIIDYEALLQNWSQIKTNCQQNQERYFISLTLLDQLDVAKQHLDTVREIIRFIHKAVSANNPSIRLQSVHEESSALRLDREEFKRIEQAALVAFEGSPFTWKALIRFWCEQLKAVRFFLNSSEAFENCCLNPLFHSH